MGDTCSVTAVESISPSLVAMVTILKADIVGRFVGVTAGDRVSRVDGVCDVGCIDGMAVWNV